MLNTIAQGNWQSMLDDVNLGAGWIGDAGTGSKTINITPGDARPINAAYHPRIHV